MPGAPKKARKAGQNKTNQPNQFQPISPAQSNTWPQRSFADLKFDPLFLGDSH